MQEEYTFLIIMEFKNTLEIVTKDIQDIEKLVSNFKNYSKVPAIELDLALARLRNLYELLLLFREDQSHPAELKSQPAEAVPLPDKKVGSERVETEILKPGKDETHIILPNQEIKPPVQRTVSKKSVDEKLFINEALGEQTQKKDIASRLQNQAIKSITGSLGINDRFYLIRELFNGNEENFRLTLEELDQSHDFNTAHTLLMTKFQWDMESEAAQMLLSLLRRKFINPENV